MLQITTLEEIKQHARIDGNDEDAILETYGQAAEETVLNLLGMTLPEILQEYNMIPKAIKLACLMLTAHSYNQREPASIQNMYSVPYTFDLMIKPYVKL